MGVMAGTRGNKGPPMKEASHWLFSSGPTGEGEPVALMKGWRFPQAQQPVADRIKPRDVVLFHGVLDLGKLNLAEKLLVKAIKAPLADSRDWEAIFAPGPQVSWRRALRSERGPHPN
jgi:hypothetical protein